MLNRKIMNSKTNIIIVVTCFLLLSGCNNTIHNRSIIIKTQIDLSKVVFIEPSSGFTDDELKIVQNFFPLVKNYPTTPYVPYNASDDNLRFQNLKNAIYGDKKYIWASLGGYGSARLFDELKMLKLPKAPKILIGYSDITFLHLLFNQWGWKTIHGAMPVDLLRKDINYKNFSLIGEILSNEKGTLSYNNIKPLNYKAHNINSIEGELIGGNLTLLANSLGTKWQLSGKNKIIFIEDIGSKGYATDRYLNQLKQAGIFKEVKAVLFGNLVGGDEHNEYALKRFADSVQFPVFYASYFGHGNDNYPLPFGFLSKISMKSDSDCELTINYDFK